MFPSGTPWLDHPVLLHSSRASTCDLTAEQCAYKTGYWRNWYQSDHVYALSTVWFIIATVGLFVALHFLGYAPRTVKETRAVQKLVSMSRYLAYRDFYISALSTRTPSIGVMLLGGVGMVFFFALTLGPKPYYWPNTGVNYGNSPPIATRTGWMATGLLPLVMALSVKSNLISVLTGVSHEKLQVFHHWVGYAMFVLALVHTFPFIVYHIQQGDMVKQWNTSLVYWTGVAALIAQAYLTFMSFSSIRNRFYEFFKATHLLAALAFVLFFFFHCDFRLSSWDYFIATGAIYIACLLTGQIRTYIQGLHHATLTPLPTNLVQIKVPTTISWKPGQHIFIRFYGLGLHSLTTHPFTIASLPPSQTKEKANEMIFYIKPRHGITARLAKTAEKTPGRVKAVTLEGPYGGPDTDFDRFGTILVVAGGSGGGFSLGIVEAALRLNSDGKRRVQVVYSTKDPVGAEWYSQSLDAVCSTIPDAGVEGMSRSLHVTGSAAGIGSEEFEDVEKVPEAGPSRNDHTSRPDIPSIIGSCLQSAAVVEDRGRRIGIFVCGPASMIHDARVATANAQRDVLRGLVDEVYLHAESFS